MVNGISLRSWPMATIGERIATACKEKGWSESRLAREAGLARSHIHAITKRGVKPTVATLIAIADALGVTIDWLSAERGSKTGAPDVEDIALRAARQALREQDDRNTTHTTTRVVRAPEKKSRR